MPLRAAVHGRDVERDGWPSVSVVMPIRDEADHLETAVASVLAQEYPLPFEVCLAVGPSSDGTEAVADRLAASDTRVHVVTNPSGITPTGLNAAIAATAGDIIVRVDGHSRLSPGYVRRAVETMIRTGAVNVGGRQVPEPESPFEEAVAAATTSWLGSGGATYRVGGSEGPVDTVYLGVFDRAAGDAVGWFAPDLVRNQDYELNIRLRGAGGEVRFDPELWAGYRPRGSWKALAKQYYQYGFWKADVARRHPGSLRLRQVAAAMVVPVLTVLVGLARRSRPARAVLGLYVLACMSTSPRIDRSAPTVGAVVACSQVSWSCGFIARPLREVANKLRGDG